MTNLTQKPALLLTAAVRPKYTNGLMLRDIQIRAKQYNEALGQWLSSGYSSIVFCDGSGLDKEELKILIPNLNSSNVEVLTFDEKLVAGKHYGYAELGLIDYAFTHSQKIFEADYFIKVTGRLFFNRLDKLISKWNEQQKLWVDARENVLWIKNQQVTTQLMLFDKDFYRENLLNIRNAQMEFYYIENLFYDALIKFKKWPGCSFRWPFNIEPIGVAAHSGKSYRSLKKQLNSCIRSVFRAVYSDFWF